MGDVRTHACVSVWLVYSKAWVLSKGSLCQLSRQAVRVLIRMCGVLLISRATSPCQLSVQAIRVLIRMCGVFFLHARQAIRVLIRMCGVLLISRATQARGVPLK